MADYDQIIRQARYISPSGKSIVIQFDDIERQSGKKYAVHELPQQDTPIVQDQGKKATEYPFAGYFSGENAYSDADALDAAFSEDGPGIFEHPMFGNLDVLATTWGESRKLVEGLGRVDFSIMFVQAAKVNPVLWSTPVADAEGLSQAADDALASSAAAAAAAFDPANAADILAIKTDILAGMASVTTAFQDVVADFAEVATDINKQIRDVTNGIDDLINAPLEMFNSLASIAKTPATVVTGIVNKITAYSDQITSIIESIPETYAQAISLVESVLYQFAGASVATTVGTLNSRSAAITAADSMGSITETVMQYIEASEAAVPGYQANVEIVSALIDIASKARASLMERAFSLRSERRITLDVETPPLNLIAQFHGDTREAVPDIDAALDEAIATNRLTGDMIIMVPAGFEWVYYA